MKCPECRTELVVKDFSNIGVELDVCKSCNGLWFDPSELLKSIEKIKDRTFDPPDVFAIEPENSSPKRPWRPCPCCSKSMNTISQTSIEVDFCESCKGFWFDAGEVVAITRQFTGLTGYNRNAIKSLPQELESIERLLKSYEKPLVLVTKQPKNKKVSKSKIGKHVSTSNSNDDIHCSDVIGNLDELANVFCEIGELGIETGSFIADILIAIISS